MLTWRELSLKVPDFDDLQVAQANPFRADYGGSSIEFFDARGHRFQVRVPSGSAMEKIKTALDQGVPVYIRYGRWNSPFKSNMMSTVYQLEIADSVVIAYELSISAITVKKDHKTLIISVFGFISMGAIFSGVRLGMKALDIRGAANS